RLCYCYNYLEGFWALASQDSRLKFLLALVQNLLCDNGQDRISSASQASLENVLLARSESTSLGLAGLIYIPACCPGFITRYSWFITCYSWFITCY
ncbi:hypothetical protein J4Q44_G00362410, partial [Coregonus suidteri]